MQEKIDQNSPEFWEQKLVESGLLSNTEIEKVEQVPIEAVPSSRQDIEQLGQDEKIKTVLASYEGLDPKIQQDIIEDLKKWRTEKRSFQEILERLDILAEHGYKLMELTSDDSDKEYKPKDPNSELDIEAGINEKNTDELIEKLEKITEDAKRQSEPIETVH